MSHWIFLSLFLLLTFPEDISADSDLTEWMRKKTQGFPARRDKKEIAITLNISNKNL